MIAASSIADSKPIPPAPAGWFDYGYTALSNGKLALIRTRTDVHAEDQRWWKAVNGESPSLRLPSFWDEDLRLSVFDGEKETDVVAVPSGSYPIVDRTSDGRWLVASSRAQEGELNGRIYSAQGAEEQAFELGDGIENLLGAPDGTLWVGYFDEGIFGGPNKHGNWPVSSGGIVHFDSNGRPCWSFNKHADVQPIADCYAMTLDGCALWACYYTDFPIVCVDRETARFWTNDTTGSTALAVQEDAIILAGGYGEDAGRITVVHMDHKAAHSIGDLVFTPAAAGTAGLVQGRGHTLHIVAGGVWSRLTVGRARQALEENAARS